jgi:hypothetical protein
VSGTYFASGLAVFAGSLLRLSRTTIVSSEKNVRLPVTPGFTGSAKIV